MKKDTMTSIYNYIKNVPGLAAEAAELGQELEKGAEKANANRALYEAAYGVMCELLGSAPMTVAELYEAGGDNWPGKFTKSKLQYGLLNYWKDEVVKIENPRGANQYRRKA